MKLFRKCPICKSQIKKKLLIRHGISNNNFKTYMAFGTKREEEFSDFFDKELKGLLLHYIKEKGQLKLELEFKATADN